MTTTLPTTAPDTTACGCDSTLATTTPDTAEPTTAPPLPDVWTGVIGVEGTPTGDGRLIDTGALRWETPIPLRYVPQDVGGHDGAYVVGTIEDINRGNDGRIEAWGTFDLDSDVGREAARHVAGALTNGVSMDLDDMSFEVRLAETALPEGEAELGALLADEEPGEDGRTVVHRQSAGDEIQAITNARIRAATLVAIPAFAEARLSTESPVEALTDATVDGSTFNWVDDVGGLPRYIKRISKHLRRKGRTEGHAIAIAVNAVKRMCATGDLNFPGKQDVNPGSRAEACAAVAEWEAKKARARATSADTETLADHDDGIDMTEDGLTFPTRELAEEWDRIENADTDTAIAWIEEHSTELGPDLTAALMDDVADEINDDDLRDDNQHGDDAVALPAAAAATAVWASERISNKPWSNFSKANYSDDQWYAATALHTNGDSRVKPDNKLPYKEPNGTINRNGVHAAAARFNQTEGPKDAKAAAAAKLRGAYRLMGEEVPDVIAQAAAEATALVASGSTPRFPVAPPADWFTNPNLPAPTPLTVTDEGHVYGHAAQWGTCHTAHTGRGECIAPPNSPSSYAYFHTGTTRTAQGTDIATGRITMDTAHAGPALNQAAAAHHYDHTGYVVADVVAGEDSHGIWLSGALRPDTTDAQIRALRAAPLSGDWRTVAGHLELMAVLAVNMPGFPIPRPAGSVTASGTVTALMASGMLPPPQPTRATAAQLSSDDLHYLRRLAARERADEAAQLRDRIEQVRQRETLRRVRKFAAKRMHQPRVNKEAH